MTRFLSREEWPLVAGGITAGVLTSALVLYIFVTGVGGNGSQFDLRSDTMRILPREDIVGGAPPSEPGRAPVIGARERSIQVRLDRFPVTSRRLRGALSITARNVVWNEDNGERFARADVVTAQLDITSAERGDVVLDNVVLRQPVVALREDAGGWNFEQVLEELLDGGDDGGAASAGRRRTFQLTNVEIVNGVVDVTRPGQRFAFRDTDGRLPVVVFSQPGLAAPYLRAATLRADFVQAEPEATLAVDVTNGLFLFPAGTVRFDVETAALDDTRLADLSGVWNPADPGYGITATGTAPGLDLEDIAFLLPESLPRTGTASFAFEVRPAEPALTELTLTDLDARSGESRLLGAVTMRLGEEYFELLAADLRVDPLALELVEPFTGPLPYDGTLVGRVEGAGRDITFDLTARLSAPTVASPFSTGLTGRVRYTDAGIVLQRVELDLQRVPLAALRAIAPALPLSGTVTGVVTLAGPPDRAPLDLDVRLELGAGVALVEGVLDLTGATPTYDLTGRILGVDLQAILEPEVPPVSLTATFAVAGAGFDPATMNTGIRLAGRFTGWEATPQDTMTLVATIRNGSLGVDTLYGSLASADVEASGSWRFIAPQSGAVTYALDVSTLRPFGPYIPVVGDSIASGSLEAVGTLSGTLERIRLAGGAAGGGLRVGAWQAAQFTGDYDLTFGGGRLPIAIVNAEARDVTTPTAGNYREGTLALRLAPPGLDVQLNATRTDGGLVDVAATGILPEEGPREVRVERARFDLVDDRWLLLRPATFRWVDGGPVRVEALEVQAERSEGRVAVDGIVLPLEDMDARVELAAVPVGDIQRLLGRRVRVDGLLWAEGTVRGGEVNPLVDLAFRVENGAVEGVSLQEFAGTVAYADGETSIDARVVVDTAGRLDVVARLPSVLRLSGTPSFELLDGMPLSGSITADDFALAPLLATVPDVRDVSGYADARVTLAGTADAPQIDGTFVLTNGAFRIPRLNQTFTEATGDVGFDGRRLVVNDLRVRSEGWMTAGGEIVLERLTEPVFDLTIVFEAFEPMGVDDHPDAAVWGEVALTGPPDALVLTGAIELADGYIQVPELGGPSFRPELVDMTRPAALDTLVFEPEIETDIIGNLRIRDLRVDVSNDTWFDAYQAQVQLAGELTVNKSGESFPIVGTLSGNRGQYTLIAGPVIRRFEIVSAEVRFRGEPTPNPAIDITARRIVLDESGRQLDVDVRITGTAETPTLQLAGGTQGQIAESELLSFLLFGMPSSTLGEQLPGDQLLGQTYVGAFWEVFALELERSLGGLGLDIFQIRLGQGTFGFESPTIVAGKQILPDVFLTVETALNGLFGDDEAALTTWTIRLDWTFDRRTRLRLALEPVYRGRGLRSSAFALPLTDPRQQLLIELRRRWSY
ncbi:MAG TPA: translocation/assembly module TamB domain-containing protein [Longimicrobiales bacterium]